MSDATQATAGRKMKSTVLLSTMAAMGASGTHCAASTGSSSTAFAYLSPEAQELIVSAMLGEYDKSGPPEISPEVADEIRQWVENAESPNNEIRGGCKPFSESAG